MMNVIKVVISVVLGLPALYSVLTLPATVMTISGVNGGSFETKLTLCLALLVLVYPALYILGLILLFTTGKLECLTIPTAHIVISLIVWIVISVISTHERALREEFQSAVKSSLRDNYRDKIQFKVDYSRPGKTHDYLCSLYDVAEANYFLVRFDTLEPEGIAEAIERERRKKNEYVETNTKLVESFSLYLDDFVVVSSPDSVTALYSYITTDELVGGDITLVERAINIATTLIGDVYITIGKVPRYAKTGFVEYAPVNGTTSLEEKRGWIMNSASFKLVEADESLAGNYFAHNYGVVPAMVMRETHRNVYGYIFKYAEKRSVSIMNGYLDYINGQMLIRGEYTDDSPGSRGEYRYKFMTIDIIIGE